MRQVLAILTAAIVAAGVPAKAQGTDDLAGIWSGLMLETGANGTVDVWEVTMTVADLDHITIDYEGLDCGGTLTYLRTVGERREYRETLTYGADVCIDGGTVGFSVNRGRLLWYWSGEGTNDPQALDVGVLARK